MILKKIKNMYLASDSGELIGKKSCYGSFDSLFRFY